MRYPVFPLKLKKAIFILSKSFFREDGHMYVLVAKHLVEDLKHWFKMYNSNSAKDMRKKMRVQSDSIFCNHQIKHEVMVLHHFKSLDDLNAFLELPAFKEALPKSGVIPPVQFTVYETLP